MKPPVAATTAGSLSTQASLEAGGKEETDADRAGIDDYEAVKDEIKVLVVQKKTVFFDFNGLRPR